MDMENMNKNANADETSTESERKVVKFGESGQPENARFEKWACQDPPQSVT